MGTVVVGIIVAGVVALAVRSMVRDKKTENPFSAAETVRIVAVTAIKGGTLVPQREYIIRKLKERGCRITRQRLIILDIILQEDCSCCKEIYYKASRQDTKIGFATVYRMVNMLEEIGAISRKNMYKVACEELCENGSCEAEKKKLQTAASWN